MHEFSIIENVIRIAEDAASQHGIHRIEKIFMVVGGMRQLVPDILRFAFGVASKGGITEGAVLEIEMLPVLARCKNCLQSQTVEPNHCICRMCAGAEMTIEQGMELMITNIEGD